MSINFVSSLAINVQKAQEALLHVVKLLWMKVNFLKQVDYTAVAKIEVTKVRRRLISSSSSGNGSNRSWS